MNYYNDFDKKACAWLRELIKAGLIPDGVVDERSITDVTADDLRGFTQCHFFAGIGGWAVALQIAGWPEDKPVWTGSCPCQPFSTAGKGNGKSDERHLWPAFARLIAECRPPVVFGEQVESAIKHGWIDDLQADMEREDYAVGFAVLGAHSVGAPHIRQRLYWVADSNSKQTVATDQRRFYTKSLCNSDFIRMADSSKPGLERFSVDGDGSDKSRRELQESIGSVAEGCEFSRVANADQQQWNGSGITRKGGGLQSSDSNNAGRMGNPQSDGRNAWRPEPGRPLCSSGTGCTCRMENTSCLGWRGGNTSLSGGCECSQQIEGHSDMGELAGIRDTRPCQTNSIWATPDWLYCRDGKWRSVESGTFPLADGVPGRVGLLRGYGNAIVPQVAAEFIGAFMEASQ
jgi:DNA (cytosine-5)-methyltransferase 1